MIKEKLSINTWNNTMKAGMTNLLNYYLSEGPLERVVEGSKNAIDYLHTHIPFTAAVRYRQHLGGVFTCHSQLMNIPGMNREVIEHLAFLIKDLDLSVLEILSPQTTRNNQVDAYVNGPDCLKLIIDEINKAERYIHLSVMLFYNDKSGNKVGEALLNALKRGVTVRLMADYGVTAIGYEKNLEVGQFKKISEKLKTAGCKLIDTFDNCYNKEEWPKKRAELAYKGVSESILSLQDFVQEEYTVDLDVINHRKFIVIDGVTAIVGSLNIGDQYTFDTPIDKTPAASIDGRNLGIPSEEEQWHDGCFRIRGGAAHSLNQMFLIQWTVLGGDLFDPADPFYYPKDNLKCGNEECTLFASFPGNPVNLIQQYYLSLIQYAIDETIIVNPYLIDQAFWESLKNISKEQAQHITICNPLYVNDHPTNRTAVRSNMYHPFEKGVSFFDYSHTGRFSHWKIAYDKQSHCVFHGSYNINERSACKDFELGVLIKGKSFSDKMKELIDHDLKVSKKITDRKEFFEHPLLHPSTYINKMTKSIT
ncbi:cardiolipin synthase [Peribacillus deserti]|uniref:Cardiolipin synthase n=1 Tax=Peribacillus deserti TaxID=673318 RepID=A0ABS2QMW9_9BACI|nr:phospholipase D-like domain-containing protein [Peribacillus deserti]MBM7694300.1 cardiolipin synthase [Peribacillus deserti]